MQVKTVLVLMDDIPSYDDKGKNHIHWLTAEGEDERACGPVSKRENSVASCNELKNS